MFPTAFCPPTKFEFQPHMGDEVRCSKCWMNEKGFWFCLQSSLSSRSYVLSWLVGFGFKTSLLGLYVFGRSLVESSAVFLFLVVFSIPLQSLSFVLPFGPSLLDLDLLLSVQRSPVVFSIFSVAFSFGFFSTLWPVLSSRLVTFPNLLFHSSLFSLSSTSFSFVKSSLDSLSGRLSSGWSLSSRPFGQSPVLACLHLRPLSSLFSLHSFFLFLWP